VHVLVTGGAGFIGSAVVRQLLQAGHQVRVLDVADVARAPDGVETMRGDVRDRVAVAAALRGVDAVSHQAAKVGLGVDLDDLPGYAGVNDLGTAVLLGTAFLACPESGASPAYKRALLAGPGDRTVLTRAFSGRWARGLPNAFTAAGEAHPEAILPYPAQNQLTRAMRQAAAQRGDAELLSLWAGEGVARIRALPAGELVRALAAELRA